MQNYFWMKHWIMVLIKGCPYVSHSIVFIAIINND
jgi:hypothetical protein